MCKMEGRHTGSAQLTIDVLMTNQSYDGLLKNVLTIGPQSYDPLPLWSHDHISGTWSLAGIYEQLQYPVFR